MGITVTGFDVEALRSAFARRDAEAVAALYADDARLTLVDHRNPPASPLVVEGRQALREQHLGPVFEQEIEHTIERVVVGDGALAYTLRCRYPNGQEVLCQSLAEVRDGLIASELGVSAWDE